MKGTTIYDIARELGLSGATVSRALNGNAIVKEETRRLIIDTAERMGYRVNIYARSLSTESNFKLIGALFHKLNSQFGINALYSLERYIRKFGYDIIISHSAESHQQEVLNAANLFQRRVDGLVVCMAADTEGVDHLKKYIDAGIPVVMFDRVRLDFPGVKIVLDNFKAAYEATTHLLAQGCKRIVHIAGKQTSDVYIERLNGYKQALKDNKIPFRAELVLRRGVDADAVPLLVQDILAMSPLPDAVFAVNDLCAALCMKQLQLSGIRVPEDMAFVGFNNDIISTLVEPNLTTIDYSGMEIGELAGRAIIDLLQGVGQSNFTVTMQAQLIERASSKK